MGKGWTLKSRNGLNKSTILYRYEGNLPSLESGQEYSRTELAKAFNLSFSLICERLKGKKIALDCYFLSKNIPKLVKWTGEHPELITGKCYTFERLGQVCDITANAMIKRLKGRSECRESDLRVKGTLDGNDIALGSSVRAQWLRRAIV